MFLLLSLNVWQNSSSQIQCTDNAPGKKTRLDILHSTFFGFSPAEKKQITKAVSGLEVIMSRVIHVRA